MEEKAIVSRKKLVENLKRISDEKLENEVITMFQRFAEKMVTDIVNRACLISKHRELEFLSHEDVVFVIEKDFDYTFGKKRVDRNTELPTEGYVSKMAEVRSTKPH